MTWVAQLSFLLLQGMGKYPSCLMGAYGRPCFIDVGYAILKFFLPL